MQTSEHIESVAVGKSVGDHPPLLHMILTIEDQNGNAYDRTYYLDRERAMALGSALLEIATPLQLAPGIDENDAS